MQKRFFNKKKNKKYVSNDNNKDHVSNGNKKTRMSFKKSKKMLQDRMRGINPYPPFTREWEWEECCNYTVE